MESTERERQLAAALIEACELADTYYDRAMMTRGHGSRADRIAELRAVATGDLRDSGERLVIGARLSGMTAAVRQIIRDYEKLPNAYGTDPPIIFQLRAALGRYAEIDRSEAETPPAGTRVRRTEEQQHRAELETFGVKITTAAPLNANPDPIPPITSLGDIPVFVRMEGVGVELDYDRDGGDWAWCVTMHDGSIRGPICGMADDPWRAFVDAWEQLCARRARRQGAGRAPRKSQR